MPSKPYRGEYVVTNIYKINTCIMGKTFSSMQLGVFCYLFDEKNFLDKFKNRKDKAGDRHICKDNNRYRHMDKVIQKFSYGNNSIYFNTWKNLLIVREPISRFISGFVQLCVLKIGLPFNHPYCFGCEKNMHCFLTHLYNDIRKVEESKKKPVYFIKYHFYPQTWQCEYNLYKDKYTIIKYDSIEKKKFYKKYLEELENFNVPKDKIKFIKKILLTTKISHSTFDKTETKKYIKTLYKSPKLLKLISKIFYDDYKEFDFPLPLINDLK
ncbi:Sulfotransferase family-containing protein [Strongyloides ratti]|uniref:Sulfotransferase family-containing protein n=1 Tax=Strongyloides ratti TaxID=34506 RepID=A0A090MZN4_STRRB|nr:Sulfotransferase family-containing protein [Strongyloides ratti]CEF69239.1 Sulfotransferase family-containing protein [Strongyloides ratti]